MACKKKAAETTADEVIATEVQEKAPATDFGWELLFDGTNYDNWKGYLADQVYDNWSIKWWGVVS